MRNLVASFLLIVLTSALTASEVMRKSLAGLRGLSVAVEPLDDHGRRRGLTIEELRSTVETRLSNGPIKVMDPDSQERLAAGAPTVVLTVGVFEIQDQNICPFMVTLQVIQAARLERDREILTMPATWESPPTLAAAHCDHAASEILKVVGSMTDELVGDYRAVNGQAD